jgi:hypothetical protein
VSASTSYINGYMLWGIVFDAVDLDGTTLTATWADIVDYVGTEGNITFAEQSVTAPRKTKT